MGPLHTAMTTPMKPRRSKVSLAANGHECYELTDAKPSFMREAVEALKEDFGFVLLREPVAGLDAMVAEIQRGDVRLYVAWDIWTGFDILSDSDIGDPVVRELATYFDARKDDHRYYSHFEHTNTA